MESRVFSDSKVAKLLKEFIVVKADPKSSSFDTDTYRHKKSGYVPEVVLLSPDESVLGRFDSRTSVKKVRQLLQAALDGGR